MNPYFFIYYLAACVDFHLILVRVDDPPYANCFVLNAQRIWIKILVRACLAQSCNVAWVIAVGVVAFYERGYC